MYKERPDTKISEEDKAVYSEIKNSFLSILCGRNNCGKSFILKRLLPELGNKTTFLGPARYNNFNLLSFVGPETQRSEQKWNDLVRHVSQHDHNIDNSPFSLQQAIAELSNEQRKKLVHLMKELLGSCMEIRDTDPNNEMSQKYVSVDGFNISYTSSGYRLVASLITSFLNTNHEIFLVDEPELGVSPEVQGIFVDFLYDEEKRKKYFPHMKSLIIATHSPIFLDRNNFKNNFYVQKKEMMISLKKTESVQELNKLQFFLLGNRFETMFLPSVIVFVEGKTDYAYLNRLINLAFPKVNVSVISSNGDSRIKDYVHMVQQFFQDIRKSPYFDRIFAVVDKRHGESTLKAIEDLGVIRENIVVWTENGIEHFYPKSILNQIFGSQYQLEIDGDLIKANGMEHNKNKLSELVLEKMRPDSEIHDEVNSKLILKIRSKVAGS